MSNIKFKPLFHRLDEASETLSFFEAFDLRDAEQQPEHTDEERAVFAKVGHKVRRAMEEINDALSALDADDEWGGGS